MRVLRNTGAVLEQSFYLDGELANADGAVTITITRSDSTAVATGAATSNPSTGKYDYTLAPQADLNILKAVWTGTFSGVVQSVTSYVEIVGNHLFTEAQARSFDDASLSDTTKYADSDIADARDRITDLLEHHTGVAWVPRFARETLDGNQSPYVARLYSNTGSLRLRHTRVSRLLSVAVGGTAYSSPELAALYLYDWGDIESLTPWLAGYRNIVVEYEHGYDYLVDGVDRIALRWLRTMLVSSDIDSRVVAMTDAGGESYSYSRSTPSGIPEVDNWIASHDQRLVAV